MQKKKGLSLKDFASAIIAEKGKGGIVETISPFIRGAAKKSPIVIIQGIHRPDDFFALHRLFPTVQIHKVFVEADQSIRTSRVIGRDKMTRTNAAEAIQFKDSDRKEMGIFELLKICDHVVQNNRSIPHLFNTVHGPIIKIRQDKKLELKTRRMR